MIVLSETGSVPGTSLSYESLIGAQARNALMVARQSEERLRCAEEAVRASEERLQFATTAAGAGVWSWTPGTSSVVVSADWRRLYWSDVVWSIAESSHETRPKGFWRRD